MRCDSGFVSFGKFKEVIQLQPTSSMPRPASWNMGRYSEARVRSLIDRYPEVTHRRTYGLLHAELIDLDRAVVLLARLQPKAFAIVYLCGLMGLDMRTAGTLTGTPLKTVHRLYQHAITTITAYLNTGRRS